MKVYYPVRVIDVEASPPHDEGTSYKVSVGMERWGDVHERVFKVQMAYDGQVSGRRSPSYPEDSDDLERVIAALQELKKGGGRTARGQVHPIGGENFDREVLK